jgi:tRNA(fMet)-specific endonuclease VapC
LSPSPALIQLDTNILVQLIRDRLAGQRVNNELSLSSRPERPLISVITVGEMAALARKLGWGAAKQAALDRIVRELIIVHPHQGDVIARYADIDYYCEKELSPACPMSQNDMWIAATASAFGATLITADTDFDRLTPRFLSRIKVHARTGEVLAP